MIVNQWVPAAHRGDAIGDSARRVRDLLRGDGPRVRPLRADDRRRPARTTCGRSATRRRGAGDVTIFHFALPSPMTEAFAGAAAAAACSSTTTSRRRTSSRRTTRRSSAWPRSAARSWRRSSAASISRSATPSTTGGSSRRWASRRPASCRSPSTPTASRGAPRRPALEQILDDGLVNFLFVGRIAPNKKIEDHIRLAEHYKRYVDAHYRFIFVGRYDARAALLRARFAR